MHPRQDRLVKRLREGRGKCLNREASGEGRDERERAREGARAEGSAREREGRDEREAREDAEEGRALRDLKHREPAQSCSRAAEQGRPRAPEPQGQRREERDADGHRLAESVPAHERVGRAVVADDVRRADDDDGDGQKRKRCAQQPRALGGAPEREEEEEVRRPGEGVVDGGEDVFGPERRGRGPGGERRERGDERQLKSPNV